MNEQRIKDYVDDIFHSVKPSAKVTEQKEELVVNITERVQDYMREGMSFDAAFDTAKNTLGDTDELTSPFESAAGGFYGFGSQTPPSAYVPGGRAEPSGGSRLKIHWGWSPVILAPFAYVLIGLLQDWFFGYITFMNFGWSINWWSWGWVIIPGSAILCAKLKWQTTLMSLSPFIYLLLGFWFNMWSFGWIIIPIAALIQGGIIKVTKE